MRSRRQIRQNMLLAVLLPQATQAETTTALTFKRQICQSSSSKTHAACIPATLEPRLYVMRAHRLIPITRISKRRTSLVTCTYDWR